MAKLNWQKLAQQQKLDRSMQLYGPEYTEHTGKYFTNKKPKPKAKFTRAQRDKALAMIRANKVKNNT
jgi:hypothetical protein